MSNYDPDQILVNLTKSLPLSQKGQAIDIIRAISENRLRARHLWNRDHGYYIVMPFDGTIIFRDAYGNPRGWVSFVQASIALAFVITLCLSIIGLLVGIPLYVSSSRSASIYNSLNHTNYTAWDFLLAQDQINASTSTIRLHKEDLK